MSVWNLLPYSAIITDPETGKTIFSGALSRYFMASKPPTEVIEAIASEFGQEYFCHCADEGRLYQAGDRVFKRNTVLELRTMRTVGDRIEVDPNSARSLHVELTSDYRTAAA